MSQVDHGQAMKIYSMLAICFALIGIGFTHSTHAQNVVIQNPKQPKINIKISPTLFTAGENGSFVLIKGGINKKQEVYSYNLPVAMSATIKAYLDTGTEIHAVALVPDGGWAVVGDGVQAHDKVGDIYPHVIHRAITNKKKVTGLAFDTANWKTRKAFVLLMGKEFAASRVSQEMNTVLTNYAKAGEHMYGVAFTPLGGWTVLTNASDFTRNVGHAVESEGYFARLKTLKNNKVRPLAVGFPPATYYEERRGWVILGQNSAEASWPSARLRRALEAAYPEKAKVYFPKKPVERDQPNKPKLAPGEKRIEFQISHMSIQAKTTDETWWLPHQFEAEGADPMIFLYHFKGRINGKDNTMYFNKKSNPLVPGLFGPFEDKYDRLNTNWAKLGRLGMIQPGAGSFTATLKPYEYYGVVVITMEYGKDHSVAEMKKWMEASFPVASRAFNEVNRNRMDQLNVNDTKDFANNMDLRRNTILRMEALGNRVRHQLHDELNRKMMSAHLERARLRINSAEFPKSNKRNFVRDVRILYTINAPDYDKNSQPNPEVARRWKETLGYARNYIPIGRQFVNKPVLEISKEGSRRNFTPFTLYGTVKQLD